jgi:hypothetical protein
MQPSFRIADIELLEIPVKLRMPFRFGVVTLRQCFQAFVRARIVLPNGKSQWGASAEMIVPKWFDKNTLLSDEDNFEQERHVLRLAKAAYLADGNAATAFGHFARHHETHLRVCAAENLNPLLANYGPALIDRALIDALCRALGQSFYAAVQHNTLGIDESMPTFQNLNMTQFLSGLQPAKSLHARHTVGLLDAITQQDVIEPVKDGLPETLQEVLQVYGHRYYKLKVSGRIDADIDRLCAIASVLDSMSEPYYATLDGNEQYQSAEQLLELLSRMRADPNLQRLMASILFIEQPINRLHALDVDLKKLNLGMPVIIDESDGLLDTFLLARDRGYTGISSKTCKGVYRSLLNAARCAAWNEESSSPGRYFMSAEDLTVQAGLSVQQDLALVNLIGVTHVERNGHHYVNGLHSRPQSEQAAFCQAHPDLYEHSHGAARLRIRKGQLQIASLDAPGYASNVMPDFSAMRPL